MADVGVLVPRLTPVLELRVRVGEPSRGTERPDGLRRETQILGGEFRALAGVAALGLAAGDGLAVGSGLGGLSGLAGEVLPGGTDHQLVRPDGTIEIDARYELRAESGAIIAVHAAGLRRPLPTGMYFRVALSFASTAPELAPLTTSLFIADGAREADEVLHTVFWVG